MRPSPCWVLRTTSCKWAGGTAHLLHPPLQWAAPQAPSPILTCWTPPLAPTLTPTTPSRCPSTHSPTITVGISPPKAASKPPLKASAGGSRGRSLARSLSRPPCVGASRPRLAPPSPPTAPPVPARATHPAGVMHMRRMCTPTLRRKIIPDPNPSFQKFCHPPKPPGPCSWWSPRVVLTSLKATLSSPCLWCPGNLGPRS